MDKEKTSENKKIVGATGWSLSTQIVSKIFPPITTMILARFFAPEIFGIIATVSLVTSFAETFNESGFQRYLIKKKYEEEDDLKKDSDVSFWSNLILSLVLWGIIASLSTPLCYLLNNPGLELALIVACAQLPLSSLSAIQIAVLQKCYNFKKPFFAQLISSVATILITLLLAFSNCGFWSIIIGNIAGFAVRAIILCIKSEWIPHFYYSFKRLKNMISFTSWVLAEGLAVWATSWFDSFIVGHSFDDHNLGIYRTSQSVVNALVNVPQYATASVSLVALSKKTDDQESFTSVFLFFQKALAFVLLPIGAGVFLYRDLAVMIVFGSGWEDAAFVIGFWSIASVLRVLFVSINTPAFIAKNKPRLPFWLQIIDLTIIVPVCIAFAIYMRDLKAFVIARSIARVDIVIPSLLLLWRYCGISLVKVLKNILKPFICTFIMICVSLVLQMIGDDIWWQIISICICAFAYFAVMFLLGKNDIKSFFRIIKENK